VGVLFFVARHLRQIDNMTRHFLTLRDLSPTELGDIIRRAITLKRAQGGGQRLTLLDSRTMVLIFEQSSTRTRVSFEVACTQLGGSSVFLSPGDSQMSRGESISDTARIVSRMADIIVLRTGSHDRATTMATHSQVPVINALSDAFHPCQLLADIQTFCEHRGEMRDARVAFVGDGSSNVCQSWINAAALMQFSLHIGAPDLYRPHPEIVTAAGRWCTLTNQPSEAVAGADLVVTDTWVGMGQEAKKAERLKAFHGFQIDSQMMAGAASDALFMHCLPAYRGQEVAAEVIDGPQSVIWDEAENRLHAQKALIEFLLA